MKKVGNGLVFEIFVKNVFMKKLQSPKTQVFKHVAHKLTPEKKGRKNRKKKGLVVVNAGKWYFSSSVFFFQIPRELG